ncbi:MAG: hypothetical protein OXI76_15765, partial [Gemmatimonadota bacterium]|nr:hypothetical protein [Gemmatimonadota bacterium]
REDLDGYHRDERAELGKAHGERAREIERGWGKFYRNRLVEAERRAWSVRATMREREREQTRERERGRTVTRIVVPRPPRPRAWWGRVRAIILDIPTITPSGGYLRPTTQRVNYSPR